MQASCASVTAAAFSNLANLGVLPEAVINPPAGPRGDSNAILAGNGRYHYVREYPGPFSIKSIVRGQATWSTHEGRFVLEADSILVLNNRQPYTILIDSPQRVQTFCLFFRDGLVDDAWRCHTSGEVALLDDPQRLPPAIGFFERMHPKDGRVGALLASMYRDFAAGDATPESLDDGFLMLARELLRFRSDLRRAAARVPAARASTKDELFRRLTRARSMVEESLGEPLNLQAIAGAACLSPYHLHRLFTQVFGETPHRYAIRRRMDRARRLLAHTEMPVTEVCLESGFQSLGSFCTLFRKENGCSPQQFRARAGLTCDPAP
jgi:AraC family transcriptional regulator